jgi:hypothetical protein
MARININTSTTLEASLGPDANPPVSFKWTVTYAGTETIIGTTNPLTRTPPAGGLPATACGDKPAKLKVYATDKDGTGTDAIGIYTAC